MGLFSKESRVEKETQKREKKEIREQRAAERKAKREQKAAEEKARKEQEAAEEKAREEQKQAELQERLDEYIAMRKKAVQKGDISAYNEIDWYIKRVKAEMRGDSNEVHMCTMEIAAIEERRGGVTHKTGDNLACRPYNPYGEDS